MRKLNKEEQQQQKEFAIFEIFKQKLGLVGDFEQSEPREPGPDFFEPNKNGLGIEITEIYTDENKHGFPLQQHEAEKEKIVQEACNKAKNLSLPPLIVDVIFSYDYIPKGKRTFLAESLFNFVRNNIPAIGKRKEIVGLENDDLPEGFWAIYIYRIEGLKEHRWKCEPNAGDVETNFSENLQSVINCKAKKFPKYLKKCKRCWLIIAALGLGASSFFEFTNEMETYQYDSPFEKLFFLEVVERKLKELKVRNQL